MGVVYLDMSSITAPVAPPGLSRREALGRIGLGLFAAALPGSAQVAPTKKAVDVFAQAPTKVDLAFDHLNATLSWVHKALEKPGSNTPQNYVTFYGALEAGEKNLITALEANKTAIPYGKHRETIARYASTVTELQRRIETESVAIKGLNFLTLKYDLAKRAPLIHGSHELKVAVAALNPRYDAGDLAYEDLVKVWAANPRLLTGAEKATAIKTIDSKYSSEKQRDKVKEPLVQAFYKHFAETVAAHRRGSDGGYNEKVLRSDLAHVLPVIEKHVSDMIINLGYMGIKAETYGTPANRNTGVSLLRLSGKFEIVDKPITNFAALALNRNVHDWSDIAFPKTTVAAK